MKTPRHSDEEIMPGFREGNAVAFSRIYDLYYNHLCYFAYQLIKDESEGQDIVSETFTKLWNMRANFESLTNVKAFLYITVRNNCFNFLKYTKRKQASDKEYQLLSESSEEYTLNLMAKTELFTAIHREIESLPLKRKAVFKLFYVDGLKIDEISRKLGMNPATVSSNKHKALDQLRNILFDKKLLPAVALYMLYKQYHQQQE